MTTAIQGQDRTDPMIDQGWDSYTPAEHAVWRTLFERQAKLLPGRACPEYLDGLARLEVAADGIPDFRRPLRGADKGHRLAGRRRARPHP